MTGREGWSAGCASGVGCGSLCDCILHDLTTRHIDVNGSAMEQPAILLFCGDCLEKMKEIPDGSVDMVLCDLPYGTTACRWDVVIPFAPLWAEYRRVCKPGSAIVLTASQPFTSALVMSNPEWFRYSWVWRKSAATGHLNAKRMPMKNHEDVPVFCDGSAPYFPQGTVPFGKVVRKSGNGSCYGASGNEFLQEVTGYPRSVLEIPTERGRLHPTQKPVALMEYMIRTYTLPGETVLDNTMGSGTTGVACVRTGRKFIGIEMDNTYYEIASQRIAATI